MSFSCGCSLLPGSSVTPEMLREHLLHTMEPMLFWELVGRRISPADRIGKAKITQLRVDYIEAILAVYPEACELEKELSHWPMTSGLIRSVSDEVSTPTLVLL